MRLIVDANMVIAALIKDSKSRQIIATACIWRLINIGWQIKSSPLQKCTKGIYSLYVLFKPNSQ